MYVVAAELPLRINTTSVKWVAWNADTQSLGWKVCTLPLVIKSVYPAPRDGKSPSRVCL